MEAYQLLLDIRSSTENLFSMAAALKKWADENNLQFSYTDAGDNMTGFPVLAIIDKEKIDEHS